MSELISTFERIFDVNGLYEISEFIEQSGNESLFISHLNFISELSTENLWIGEGFYEYQPKIFKSFNLDLKRSILIHTLEDTQSIGQIFTILDFINYFPSEIIGALTLMSGNIYGPECLPRAYEKCSNIDTPSLLISLNLIVADNSHFTLEKCFTMCVLIHHLKDLVSVEEEWLIKIRSLSLAECSLFGNVDQEYFIREIAGF